MKQLLFLLLFPCLAMAQYQGNGNQKITLGEQTSADGLVYRGLAADTTRKPSVDTMAYILLDTNTNIIWQYKKATNNAWTRVGGSISSGVTGVLPVANGGTGITTFTAANRIPYSTSATALTTNSIFNFDGTKLQLGLPVTAGNIRYNNVWNRRHAGGTLNYYNSQYTTIDTIVSNSTIFQFGSQYRVRQAVADNITNNGYALGLDLEVSTINSLSGYSGTINNMYGMRVQFGNQSGGGNSPTINNLYGLQIQPQYTTGTTTNLYAVYIGFDGTGGTVTNNYGIYQATANIRNYFNGNIGIGTTSPLAKLNVMGTVRINSASAPDANYYLQLENSSSQKAKANAWDTYSDKRIKTDIKPIFNAIDKVNLLNPVYYQKHDSYVENDFLNIDFDSSVKSLGFIAQEVYNVIPEAVNTGTTNELWAMDYTKIIPILTKAIQEQNLLIKALEQRILTLENK